jgi:peptide/nickel transport system substrate-binding protein
VLAAEAFLVVVALGVAAGSAPAATRSGGTLRVALPQEIPTLDPALWRPLVQAIWYATCAPLMAWRDAAAPEGFAVRPEAAAGPPKVSRDGRTYVFTVRKGLRFSDGSPLTAANFKRALDRVMNPVMDSPSAYLLSDVKRVSASGERLRIELSRPDGDLPTRLALPLGCPVPLGFPVDPAGIDLTVGSGPYSAAAGYVPHRQLVLMRNRYYKGTRPHRVDRIVITSGGDVDDAVRAVESGDADVVGTEISREIRDVLAQRYGVNKKQLFRIRGLYTVALALNTARPLFRHNVALRKAINLAVNRTEIARAGGGWPRSFTATDQILPRWIPGWTDYHLYPVAGPKLRLALKLARPNLRGGRAIMYVSVGDPLSKNLLDEAQVIVRDLRKIGLEVDVKDFSQAVLGARAGTPGEPYDMILSWFGSNPVGNEPAYPDPAGIIDRYLAGENARKPVGNTNFAYFDNPAYNRQIAAADRLSGPARYRAFSKLDANIMRHDAPLVPLTEGSSWLFLSKRVGCLKLHPVYRRDYAAMCLR